MNNTNHTYIATIRTTKFDYIKEFWKCTIAIGEGAITCMGNSELEAIGTASRYLSAAWLDAIRNGLSGHIPGSASGAAVDDMEDASVQSPTSDGTGA